jgi:hypothetical protein
MTTYHIVVSWVAAVFPVVNTALLLWLIQILLRRPQETHNGLYDVVGQAMGMLAESASAHTTLLARQERIMAILERAEHKPTE